MQNIQLSTSTFLEVVKKQKQANGTTYRLLTYVLSAEVEEGLLLYNTLSCEMVLLEGDEVTSMLSLPYLRENWFAVPEDFNDMQFAQQYREIHQMFQTEAVAPTGYTIMTTTDCNARCFYCYEMGRSRIPMTEATALRVADYITENYRKLQAEHDTEEHPEGQEPAKVHISWFGGEPLYNSKVIDIICNRLKEAEVPYRSTMISNGYLFTDELVHKAKEFWKLGNVQITLDGTEQIYNRSKAYIHREGSAYERVIRNIGLLLDAEIGVTVRMNIDMHNADDLKTLACELAERFGDRKGFNCYSHPLFEMSAGERNRKRTLETRRAVYEKQQELQAVLEDLKLSRSGGKLLKDLPTNHCMADSGKSVVIAPTGQIGLCEHYTENEFFSHIDTPEQKDSETIRRFAARCEDIELCNDCAFYPQCIRLKMCEEGAVCFPEIKQQHFDDLSKAMVAKYERWKKKLEEPEEDVNEKEIC